MKRKTYKSSSDVLCEIAQDPSLAGNLTLMTLIKRLEERAFGIVLLLFSLPSALPLTIIPGYSVLFCVPIAFFALQMMLGQKSLWLPNFIGKREIPHDKLANIIKTAVPYLKKIEHLLKPRWGFMTSRLAECLTGLIIFLLAVLLMLPIPFSNFIYAFVLILFSLGITEKDGVVIAICFVFAILALGIIPLLFTAIKKLF